MIERIVAEQSSASVMSGQSFVGSQQPAAQQYGAQDSQQAYSTEWAAYHAAQAAAQQQQQQQQQTAPTSQPSTAASGQSTNDSYREEFFRYAYYYGEDAARKYYGAWSPPVGTPNPYGVNPNGIQPAPAPVAAPAQAAAPTQAVAPTEPATTAGAGASQPQQQQPRETGRRKVSNLPAWMTKG